MNTILRRIKIALTDEQRINKTILWLNQNHQNLLTYKIEATIIIPKDKTKKDLEKVIQGTLKEMISNACDKFNEQAEIKLAYPQNVKELNSSINYNQYDKEKDNYKSATLITEFALPLLADKLKESKTFLSIIHNSKSLQDVWQRLCNNWLGKSLNNFDNAMQQVPNKSQLQQDKIQFMNKGLMTYK